MAHSSLVGIDRAALEPEGRDTATLGPSDSSDSGSDMVGTDEQDANDPTEPVDFALRADAHRGAMSAPGMRGSASDAAGTGESRSAAGDAGGRGGGDISVDRVFDPADENADGSFSASELDAVDNAAAGEVLDDEGEGDYVDEDADSVGGDAIDAQPQPERSVESPAPDMREEDDVAVDDDGDEDDDPEADIADDATSPKQSSSPRSLRSMRSMQS